MKISITKINPDVKIELSSETLYQLINEMEKLKDDDLVDINTFPVLWKMSAQLKQKGLYYPAELIENESR